MSNPALYYIKWLVYSASDGFGNGWKKIFYQFGSQFISGQQSPKTPCLFKETLDILINKISSKTEPDISGIKDNSDSSFGLWPYDIPGEDWIYKCGNDWCVDTTLTINCSMFNNTQE